MADTKLDPTSIEAWRARRTITVDLDGVAVKIKKWDLLALLSGDGDVPNPLLSAVSGHMGASDDEVGRALMSDPEKINSLRESLNAILLKVVVAPPLVEQGHEDGVSVDEFTLEEKMIVFEALAGGAALRAARRFPPRPFDGVDAVADGERLPEASE